MQKFRFLFLLLFVKVCFSQQSDFNHINFNKADYIAKSYKSKRILELNKITFDLTKNLETDVEKVRAIYIWICNNIANDFRLYSLNELKRKRYKNDSIKLDNWNSKFKKKLFKKLLRKKRTICTGYAYLLKEMCNVIGIESKIVNGIGRTSTVDLSNIKMPNHTWNVVKLNSKWYLCDPTWSTGISFPDDGKFQFKYNNGYFLTEPNLFFLNHYPIEQKYSLLNIENSTFSKFLEFPILYGEAFNILKKQIYPTKMHHTLQKNEVFTFQYLIKKQIDLNKIKFVIYNGLEEKNYTPKIELQNNILTLKHIFKSKGFFDFHLYINNEIISTYTFKITK
ncbi:transglutaminase domain-containing protein [uncultured Polaribacter sp.]|uniref:transglutaminase domain-containing protein n=1 Tax=uncultured Polaribacter sp. TaxID=174711 RepID=UPI002617A0A0|nr:transglutaminase domain-containing protein [uncultured Polaribacter sp.]